MKWQDIVKKNDLAISIISASHLGGTIRLDAEHYQAEFIEAVRVAKTKQHKKLSELVTKKITTGHTPSMKDESFYGGKVKFIKTNNLRENYISNNYDHFLSERGHTRLKNSALKPNDVIVTIIGATHKIIGRAARVFPSLGEANINQNIALIRPSIPAGYLTSFLNSNLGRKQLYYLSRQTEQVNLNCVEVGDVVIPIPNIKLLETIEHMHNEAHELALRSQDAFVNAENTLLYMLGLAGFTLSQNNISIRLLDSVRLANRFDAEYWQPKYDAILEHVKAHKQVSTIGNEFTQIKNNFKPVSDQTYRYIEIGDVSISSGEVEYQELPSELLPANAKIRFEKRQLIASKVRPNRGAIAILDNHADYIGSGAFTALKENGRMPLEVLSVYLKLKPIRDLLLRYNIGTSYPVIRDEDILNLPIPVIEPADVLSIVNSVMLARKSQAEAKGLIERAKRAVEVFIEQSETEALKAIKGS